jgi:2,4-dienoyl-CoA reductase-like NADH-dependent reductase (Old Yellow Enzyme family)
MSVLDPISFGHHQLRNRAILAPMTTYSSHENGVIREDEIPYLERRAQGFGAIMTAACYVHPSGHAFRGQWGCDSDDKLESLKSVADAIHRGGSKAILQIHHGGRQCPPDLSGGECISASDVPYPREGAATPRPMTEDEILRTIQDFGDATRRAREAGYDGVEIHGANTYLLQQFVSPQSNLRTDRWKHEELLFSNMIVEAVLREKGEMFIGYRFSPEESESFGIRFEHTRALIEMLCNSELDFLHVSLREFDQPSLHDEHSEPVLKTLHGWIKGRKPLIGVGGVKSGEDANRALTLGCEAIAIGRVGVSEPEWVQKVTTGGSIRTTLMRDTFEDDVTLPAGLASKIRAVPGWFDVED